MPEAIKYLDLREFALPLAQFAIYQAKVKEYAGFWTLLAFLSSHIDTPTCLELLEEHVTTLFPLHSQKNRVLLQWLTTICEGSVYPIATCLYIAAFVEEHGPDYFSEEEAEKLYHHFVNMAHSLMAETESEHLTAIMLEMPTNSFVFFFFVLFFCFVHVLDICLRFCAFFFVMGKNVFVLFEK